jgi:hypothetical protein
MWKLPARLSFPNPETERRPMVRAALDLLGTLEAPGAATHPAIMGWAKAIETICRRRYDDWAADFFNADSIAGCGPLVGSVAARTCQGRPENMPPTNYWSARAWADLGRGRLQAVRRPAHPTTPAGARCAALAANGERTINAA